MLYIVGTPIGNIKDMSVRAHEVLAQADIIVAESVPDTKKLLSILEIPAPTMIKYNDRNKDAAIPGILEAAREGHVVFVTSAGMPSISDPGSSLVAAAHNAQIDVQPIPGPSALSTAVAMSGLSGKRVIFIGFLPRKKSRINDLLTRYVEDESLVVFFESPFRIVKSLEYIQTIMPDVEVAIGREMTKKFETYYTDTIENVLGFITENAQQQKGEFTVIVKKK